MQVVFCCAGWLAAADPLRAAKRGHPIELPQGAPETYRRAKSMVDAMDEIGVD